MSDKPNTSEINLRYLREFAAILLAAVILVGFLYLLRETYLNVGEDIKYNRSKDLLLILNGFLGIIIGYYFNRASTETRAEKAESAAKTAHETAQKAVESNQTAMHESNVAHETTRTIKNELRNLSTAAKNFLDNSNAPQTRGSAVKSSVDSEITSLQEAIDRAEKVL